MTNYIIMGYSKSDRFDEQFCRLLNVDTSLKFFFIQISSEL